MVVKSGYGLMLNNEHVYDWLPAMLTPAGGMDRIAYALAAKVHYRAEVREIRRTSAGGVRIGYVDRESVDKTPREVTGDFCICTIPPKVRTKKPADFSPETAAGLTAVDGAQTFRIGLDGPFNFAGEHLTHLGAWMAGAFTSAQMVCGELHRWSLS